MPDAQLSFAKSFVPAVYRRLAAVGDGQLSYKHYGARHPGGIFAIQFSDLLSSFKSLVAVVQKLQATAEPCSETEEQQLKWHTRDFLFQLMNFFECGYEIFLCFLPPLARPRPGQALHVWFKAVGYESEVASYFRNTDPLLGRYRRFFNALKHSSNRVSIFQFIDLRNPRKALGFYLEGVQETGAIGPISELHPVYYGLQTAWSYSLHLRNWYFLIHQISSEMDVAIQRLCSRAGTVLSLPADPPALEEPNLFSETATAELVRVLEDSMSVFYPQERTETILSIGIDSDKGTLTFAGQPAGERVIPGDGSWTHRCTSRGDGFSRSWQLLYFVPVPR